MCCRVLGILLLCGRSYVYVLVASILFYLHDFPLIFAMFGWFCTAGRRTLLGGMVCGVMFRNTASSGPDLLYVCSGTALEWIARRPFPLVGLANVSYRQLIGEPLDRWGNRWIDGRTFVDERLAQGMGGVCLGKEHWV